MLLKNSSSWRAFCWTERERERGQRDSIGPSSDEKVLVKRRERRQREKFFFASAGILLKEKMCCLPSCWFIPCTPPRSRTNAQESAGAGGGSIYRHITLFVVGGSWVIAAFASPSQGGRPAWIPTFILLIPSTPPSLFFLCRILLLFQGVPERPELGRGKWLVGVTASTWKHERCIYIIVLWIKTDDEKRTHSIIITNR